MAKNRDDYGKSMQMIITGISIFTCFTLCLLFFGWIDNLFFGSELSAYLSNRYYRYMVGFIMIPIFAGGAFMMYWGTRANNSFMDGFYDKLDLPTNAETENQIVSSIERKVKEYAKNDDQFNQLLRRFYGYLRSISGSGMFGVRQAIDLHSGGKSYIFYYFIFGFAIVPFLLVYVISVSYIESYYHNNLNELMKNARLARPEMIAVVIASIVFLLMYVAFRFVRLLAVKILGSIMHIGDKVLSTQEIDPWNKNFKYFMTEKHQYTIMPWRAYFYPLIIFCSVLPLSLGLVLLNVSLILWGGGAFIIGILLKRFDNGKGPWFQFKNAETIVIGKGTNKTQLSIREIEEVIVHYQSIKDTSLRISSQSALMRSLANRVMSDLMDSPELIPSTITFFTRKGLALYLPLRSLQSATENPASHEIEFFFAFWLKSNGFTFELAASNEDAGDWRALKIK